MITLLRHHPEPVIVMDEVQFYTNTLIPVVYNLSREGRAFILVGLPSDAWGKRFGPTAHFAANCHNHITMLTGCTYGGCTDYALFTQKVGGDPTKQVEVGGSELYVPRCAKHHTIPE